MTRSAISHHQLICCDCGRPVGQRLNEPQNTIKWWLLFVFLGALLGSLGLFVVRDELQSGDSPEFASGEPAKMFRLSRPERRHTSLTSTSD
jgi:hypothetical protein